MSYPVVAIVGRPNVGKSSLFNYLAGRRISIVDPTAGVTRDRVSTIIQLEDRFFELVDTGGMGIEDVDNLTAEVEQQIEQALRDADVILFVVDVRSGILGLDEHVAERLRKVTKPVVLVVNKCDTLGIDAQVGEFFRLGFQKLICASAEQKRGKPEILQEIQEHLPAPTGEAPAEVAMKLAIVGRRNTGKSTFINALAQADRMIVSEIPGTTRDSVDVRFERDGKVFIAIDTAGVRRKKSLNSDIEFYSLHRAERSIRRADVVLLFFDPRLRVSKVDKQLAEYIQEQFKPAVFVVNKWDLMKDQMTTGRYAEYLQAMFPMLDHLPLGFITAKKGKNTWALLNLAQNLHKQASARVSTGDLNRLLQHAVKMRPPPMRQNRQGRVYFATQASTNPPNIVLFTNGPELFDQTYQRYLLKYLRHHSPFKEVPIQLTLRAKKPGDSFPQQRGEPDDAVAPAPHPDLTGLEFQTEVSEEEMDQARKRKDHGLWDI
ncbi:MAG TPA: ribosome biogenesis GTPase Der [Gemmataceae bacterium]|nr:ribosome biogenesis GTPase Der [Gemmataceae bacterium]